MAWDYMRTVSGSARALSNFKVTHAGFAMGVFQQTDCKLVLGI
jgi:hypothetical protein